jgi:hypothetical protein
VFRLLHSRLAVGIATAVAVALAVAPLALTAQAAPAARRSAAATSSYTLTMADVHKFGATMKELGLVIKATPALEDRFTSRPDESVEQIAARLASVPQFRPAFAKGGMTPRQFALTQFTILGAGMAVGMPKGARTPEQLVQDMGIAPANVAFMRAHQAEIQALFKQLRAGARADDASDDDDADEPAR